MKKIILFLFIQIALISQIFALDIEIQTDKNTYNLDENIILQIEISSDNSNDISIENIFWLENFSQIGSSQRQETSIINGEINTKKIIELILRANEDGEYNIWPIEIKSEDDFFESNWVTLTVWESEITQQNNQNTSQEDNNPENNSQVSTSQENNISETDLMENFIESKKIEINYKKFSYYSVGIILFFILFYLFIIKFLENKPKKQQKEIIIEQPKISQEDFIQKLWIKLTQLEKQSELLSKNEFYKQLNLIFRNYFEYLWVENAYTKTYSDLKWDNIEKKLFWMFEKSYFEEFSSAWDELTQRKQMIMNFMIYLK